MKITWDKNSTAYKAVAKVVLEKYKYTNESIVVQIRLKYSCEQKYKDITELFINDGEDYGNPDYIWENDWWEGQQDVELIATAPISEIDLSVTEDFTFN